MAYEEAMTALADPTRRAAFEQLRSGPKTVGAVAATLPVSRPAVSQHLKVLKDAGLVEERRQGTRRIYSVRTKGLEDLRQWIEGFWDEVLDAYQEALENDERDDDGDED